MKTISCESGRNASINSPDPENVMARSLAIYFPDIGLAIHRGIEAYKIVAYDIGAPVLDLGCGDGKFTCLWSSLLMTPAEVVGCDISPERLNEALKSGRIQSAVVVGSAIPVEDESVETVIANSVLTHVPEIDRMIAEVSRVLEPGGIFFATVPGPDFEDQLAWVRLFRSIGLPWLAMRIGDRYHVRWQQLHRDGKQVWARRFAAHGLSLVDAQPYPGKLTGLVWSLIFSLIRAGYGKVTVLNILNKLWFGRRHMPDVTQARPGIIASYLAPLLEEPGKEGGSLFLVAQKTDNAHEIAIATDNGRVSRPSVKIKGRRPDIDSTLNWLINSHIRITNEAPIMKGGYGNLIDSRIGKCTMLYCEITGYAAQFWLRQRNVESLNRAIAAGDCLLRVQALQESGAAAGAFPYGLIRPGAEIIPAYFSFDAGICASAFVDIAVQTGERRFVEGAERSGGFLIRMQTEDGSFKAMYTPQPDHFGIPQIESWFGDHCVLHGKIAIALLKLWKLTGESKWKEAACRLLDWVCKIQGIRGDFPQWHGSPLSMSHTHCYATEGLLYAGLVLSNDRYLNAGIRGAEWLRLAQRRSGALHRDYRTECAGLPRPERWSILHVGPVAQAARIWWVADQVTPGRPWAEAAARALAFLYRVQSREKKSIAYGAFPQSVRKIGPFERKYHCYSPWEAMFAYEAVRLWTTGNDDTAWSIF